MLPVSRRFRFLLIAAAGLAVVAASVGVTVRAEREAAQMVRPYDPLP
jgi:hypothetical protein